MTLSISMLFHYVERHYADYYPERHFLSVIKLNAVMLSVVVLSVVAPPLRQMIYIWGL
jgi:hypothetical protein